MESHEPPAHYRITDLPVDERPRERLLQQGPESLSHTELLAIVLRTGARGRTAIDLARELLQRFDGDLVELAAATPAELAELKGIGDAKAAQLKAIFSLARRMATQIRQRRQVGSPEDAAELLREVLRGKKQEELWALLLDTKNYVVRELVITVGLLDRSQVHAREVFRPAIQYSAAKIILAHNHPSGDPTPSSQDIRCTKDLVKAGRLIGIEVVDHIIIGRAAEVGERDYISMREAQLMTI